MESLVDGYTYDDQICETCVLAKHERKIIRIPVQRTTTPFELVHSDTCGLFATKSIGGATHFIVFIDDFSHYAYVYPLLNKLAGTCTGIFQVFQKKVENWGYTIKRFRCENGRGEYDNRLFRGILAAGGISFEPAPPYTQHKNGVAERTIGVLTRKARSLLLDSRAPTEFWAEAICTATYLHGRTPNGAVDGKTPYEAFHKLMQLATGSDDVADEPSSDKLPLHHLRRFGCVSYKHTPALKGHTPPALQGHAPALQGHAPAVEHMPDEAVAAPEYAPDEVVSASERLEPDRLEPKSSERLDPKRSEPEGLCPLSTASGLAPLRRSMRMKIQKPWGNAAIAGQPGQSAAHELAPAAHDLVPAVQPGVQPSVRPAFNPAFDPTFDPAFDPSQKKQTIPDRIRMY